MAAGSLEGPKYALFEDGGSTVEYRMFSAVMNDSR
jgi:hypothetical protein